MILRTKLRFPPYGISFCMKITLIAGRGHRGIAGLLIEGAGLISVLSVSYQYGKIAGVL